MLRWDKNPLGFWVRNVGAFIIRIESWGPLYYSYKKEPQT